MDNNLLELIALIVCIAAGVIFCFLGNRWRRVAAAIYGFALGFVAGHILFPLILSSLTHTELLLCCAGAGVVIALLCALWIYFGIFMIGFGGGALLCLLIISLCGLNPLDWYVYGSAIVISCVIGALTLNVKRVFLSIFTAFIGAALLALAIQQIIAGGTYKVIEFFTKIDVLKGIFNSSTYLIALAILFAAGAVVQMALTSRKKD